MREFYIVAQRFTHRGGWQGSRQVPGFYVQAWSAEEAKAMAEEVLAFEFGGSITAVEREPALR